MTDILVREQILVNMQEEHNHTPEVESEVQGQDADGCGGRTGDPAHQGAGQGGGDVRGGGREDGDTSGLVGKWLFDHYLELWNNCVR